MKAGRDVPVTIAIDVMGGDFGPSVTIEAALRFLERHEDAKVILVGQPDPVRAELSRLKVSSTHPGGRSEVCAASEIIEMDDPPAQAMRRKRDSSMHRAVGLVKDGAADAAISAGNTGAWMAISSLTLRTLDGVDRPALCSLLPNQKNGLTYMLDLGANVDCKANHLFQFAVMGSALVASVEHKEKPPVGLLNIGSEDIKGNEAVKTAAEMLRAASARDEINFFGNVEGNDIFKGAVDVVVCDGFVGNVALKTAEGMAQMIGRSLKSEFERNALTKLGALFSLPAINAFRRRYDHRRYNGATFLGLNGIVVKSHGSADAYAFGCALDRAYNAVKTGVLAGITSRLAQAGSALKSAA
jgi:glycerol-3-phosphate acyltransferase PlsX